MIPPKQDMIVTSTPLRHDRSSLYGSLSPVYKWNKDSRYLRISPEKNDASTIATLRQEINTDLQKIFYNEREARYQDMRKRMFLETFRNKMTSCTLPTWRITGKEFEDLLNACGKRYHIQFSTYEVQRVYSAIRCHQIRSHYDTSGILRNSTPVTNTNSRIMSHAYESRLFCPENISEYSSLSALSSFESRFFASKETSIQTPSQNCVFKMPFQKPANSLFTPSYPRFEDVSKDSGIMSPGNDVISSFLTASSSNSKNISADSAMDMSDPECSFNIKTDSTSPGSAFNVESCLPSQSLGFSKDASCFYETPLVPQQWDILKELSKMGCYETTSLVLSFLSPKDVQAVSSVSRSYRAVVVNNKVANGRRCNYLNGRKSLGKENKHGTKSGKTNEDRVLFQELANHARRPSKQPLACKSSNTIYDSFVEVAKHLKKSSDVLLKCPKCLFPSKCINGNQYQCTRRFCSYEFCRQCTSPFNENHQCQRKELEDVVVPRVLIGSTKSKRSLRRL